MARETLQQVIDSVNAKLGGSIYSMSVTGADDGVILASNGEGIDYLVMNGDENRLMSFMLGVRNGINSMIQQKMIEKEQG